MTADDLIRAELAADLLRESPRQIFPTFLWETRPNPEDHPWGVIFLADIAGGSLWRSNGSRWVPVSAVLPLQKTTTQVTVGATTAEVVVDTLSMPYGFLGPNDAIECNCLFATNATANSRAFTARIGGTGTDGDQFGRRASTSASAVSFGFVFRFDNCNSLSSQVGSGMGTTGDATTGVQRFSRDTYGAVSAFLTAQKGVAGDTLVLHKCEWSLVRGV